MVKSIPPVPTLTPDMQALVDESNLEFALFDGVQVGLNEIPPKWLLAPKDRCSQASKSALRAIQVASAVRYLSKQEQTPEVTKLLSLLQRKV